MCLTICAQADQFGDFTYTDNGTSITITAYPTTTVGELVIPEFINSKPVTAIGPNAFEFCEGLTSVSIPESVTVIGDSAFHLCSSLTDITIHANVTTIGDFAFAFCGALTAIAVDSLNPVFSSTDGMLFDKNQTTLISCPSGRSGAVSVPIGVTSISRFAFFSCASLTSVIMPDSITSIGNSAFVYCNSLASVNIPGGVSVIEYGTFFSCTGMVTVAIPSSVTIIGDLAFQQCTSLTEITIPTSVTAIGTAAFAGCTHLASITLPSSVTSIGGHAFHVCLDLASVTIPSSVTSIGDGVFAGCASLTRITLSEGLTTIGNGAFRDCESLPGITIPASITSLGDEAFAGCNNLTSACFQGTAPTMGYGVFDTAADTFAVYFFDGAAGFTSPTWTTAFTSYPSVNMGGPSPVKPWLVENGFPFNESLQADPNGDGVNLLMAYALGLNPKLNLSCSMPRAVISGNEMSLRFYGAREGVIYTVQASADLKHWNSDEIAVSAPEADGFRAATISRGEGSRFMRLVVSY